MDTNDDLSPPVASHTVTKKKKPRKTKTKQTFVCEVGKDGKTQLAGKKDNTENTHPEVDPEYHLKFAQERHRPNEFRCNFTFKLEMHETGNETRLETVLRLYKETALDIGILDPSTVFQPWIPGMPKLSPPVLATEIDESTEMRKFVRQFTTILGTSTRPRSKCI
jgi:hypothetical protein